ncbi:MAG: hypothetical protein RJA70_10 [Pseudomonadota bacterium]|jgi:outer membrane biosynthesis protein TonB
MIASQLALVLTVAWVSACGAPTQEPETPSEFTGFEDGGEPALVKPVEAPSTPLTPPDSEQTKSAPLPIADTEQIPPLGSPVERPRPLGNTVEETRTTQVIGEVIRKNRQAFRDCYDQELARSPGLRGNITLHFVLDPKGQVSLSKVNTERTTLTEPGLGKCTLAALNKLQFPPSSRGFESTVNYPFDFKP